MSNISEWSTTAGSNNSSPPDGWPEGMQRSAVNDCAREMMAALARMYQDINGSLLSTGTSTAYTVTTNSLYAALNDQAVIAFRVHTANGASATLNVDGLGAKAIHRRPGVAVAANDLPANSIAVVQYNPNLDRYELLSMTPVGDGTVTFATIQDITTDRLLGRDTTGTGDVEEISLAAPLSFSGSQSIGVDAATTTAAGKVELATAAEMVTGTDAGRTPSVSTVKNHEGVVKAWAYVDEDGVILDSYGVTSVSSPGAGEYTVTLSVTMANSTYAVVICLEDEGAANTIRVVSRTATSFNVETTGDGPQDHSFSFAVYGTLA